MLRRFGANLSSGGFHASNLLLEGDGGSEIGASLVSADMVMRIFKSTNSRIPQKSREKSSYRSLEDHIMWILHMLSV